MMKMRLFVGFFFILSLSQGNGIQYGCDINAQCGCSLASTVLTRIIGGETAVQGSWAWTVSIRIDGIHFCGGTIISPSFIITAAHCTNILSDLKSVSILLGTIDLQPSTKKYYQIRSINRVFQHPDYVDFLYVNDIALIRLSTPLDITNKYTKPICLPTGLTPQPPDNIDMIAVGWGITNVSSDQSSPVLRQVTLKSIKSKASNCKLLLRNSTTQFCAGTTKGGKDTCQGDSGGPLMAFVAGLWQLYGITSNGVGCALPEYAGIYTRISSFIPWIKSILQTYDLTTKKPAVTTTKKPAMPITLRELLTTKKPSATTTIRKLAKITTKRAVATTSAKRAG